MAPSPWRQRRVQSAEVLLPRGSGEAHLRDRDTSRTQDAPAERLDRERGTEREQRQAEHTAGRFSGRLSFSDCISFSGFWLTSDLLTACSGIKDE